MNIKSNGVPELYGYAFRKKWSHLIKRAKACPHEAQYVDIEGCTALHVACYCQSVPIDVVIALLKAFPESTAMQNLWGKTPIHIALHCKSCEVMSKILEADISAISVSDTKGFTPLTHLAQWYGNKINDFLSNDTILSSSKCSHELNQGDKELKIIWKKASLLLKAAYHGSLEDNFPDGTKWNIVHACAGIDGCPPNIFRLAAKNCPYQLRESDGNGSLPLHIAAAVSSPEIGSSDKEYSAPTSSLAKNVANVKDFNKIESLTDLYRDAAMSRNNQGKLPLHLAICNGKQWKGCVGSIFDAFPGAVTFVDKEMGLFPFMLAAIGKDASLCTIYNLLRACPEIDRFMA